MGAATQLQFILDLDRTNKPAILNSKDRDYSQYSKFTTRNDFDNQYAMIMCEYKHKFSIKQLRVVSVICGFAGSKYYGVCTATYKKVAAKYEERFGDTVSRDTWREAIDKCDIYGILNKHDGVRPVDRRPVDDCYKTRTANVLIFNRYDEVKAYAIARMEIEQKEMERLLEAEYARMTPSMTFAYNAKKWAQEKAIKEAEEAARKKAAEEAAKAKRASLYQKIGAYLSTHKIKDAQLGEMTAIAYGSVNKMLKQVDRMTKEQAEDIAYSLFIKAITTQKIKKTYAALYSYLLRDNLDMLTGKKDVMTSNELKARAGQKVEMYPEFMIEQEQDATKRAEMIASNKALEGCYRANKEKLPDWWDKRKGAQETAAKAAETNVLDFEAKKKKVEAKLAALHKK